MYFYNSGPIYRYKKYLIILHLLPLVEKQEKTLYKSKIAANTVQIWQQTGFCATRIQIHTTETTEWQAYS